MEKKYIAPTTDEIKLVSGKLMDMMVSTSPFGGEFAAPGRYRPNA